MQAQLEPKLPRGVREHDEVLEEQPLHDFGYVHAPDLPLPGPDGTPLV